MNEADRQNKLRGMLNYGDRHFDPASGLLLLPMTSYRNVHAEHLDDTPRHPIRESLNYALVLLEMAERSLQGRAEAILSRVIDLQETANPAAETHGLWPYFLEEPVSSWRWPDLNWADFNGMILLLIWHRHRRRLSSVLSGKLAEAIRCAAACIRRRDVDLNYTNIAIKGTFVTLSAAEMSGDVELLAYALDRLKRLGETVSGTGGVAEYSSPTYVAISLAGLHAIESYVCNERAQPLLRPLLERFWQDVAERFHSETGELAGPHARAYAPTLSEAPGLLGALIEKATRGMVTYASMADDAPFCGLYACVMNVEPPARIAETLAMVAKKPRQVTRRSHVHSAEAPRVQTTWLEPAFCLGSVSFQDGWEQRHNLIAYWKSKYGGVGILQHRYLRDDRPCCSGYFMSAQHEGSVVVGAFLGSFADHHVSVHAEGTTCGFLGPVLELNAAGEPIEVWVEGERLSVGEVRTLGVGDVLRVRLSAITIEWTLTRHDILPEPVTLPRVDHASADRLRIVLPHYEGRRRRLLWRDFDRAASAYSLCMRAAGATLAVAADLEVTVPDHVPASSQQTEEWAREQQQAVQI